MYYWMVNKMEILHTCMNCRWCKFLEDSRGQTIYLCLNCESPCYLQETGILGDCDEWVDEKEDWE